MKNIFMKLHKLNWLKKTSDESAMHQVIKNKKKSEVVIHSQTKKNGRLWTAVEPETLKNLININGGFYEVITDYQHKVYFDIDKDGPPEEGYLERITEKIEEIFPDGDMAISGSVTEDKTSYHIILNHYLVDSEAERMQLKAIVKYLKLHFDDGFDWKVYTQNRNMKCINQSKDDGRVQSIIMNEDVTKHFITCFTINEYYTIPQFEYDEDQPEEEKKIKLSIDMDKSNEPFNVGELPKLKLTKPQNFDINLCTPLEILQLLPLDSTFNHSYTHLVARFCFFNNIDFPTFLSWYGQKSQEERNQKKWNYHWSNLSKFPPVLPARMLSLLVKFYPDLRKEKHYELYMNMFELETTNIKKVERLSQECFENIDEKFVVLNTGMGSGKTYQAIEYLSHHSESYIWMTPNIALAQNTTYRLEERNIPCSYYNDCKKQKETISTKDQLVICMNSLHYTDNKEYKVVIVDEIETFLIKWFNNATLEDNKAGIKYDCWKRFLDIIEKADKVIFLDAFTSKITTDFINALNNNQHKIYQLYHEPVSRDVKFLGSYYNWLNDIIETIKQGKKPFIFYPYLRNHHSLPSMQELKDLIESQTNSKGVCYNSKVADADLEGLKNVNESWASLDFVITNTKITVGINYELSDFHQVFISVAGFSSSRDLIQVSYRCRNLIDNIIKVAYIENHNTTHGWVGDEHLVGFCPVYQSVVKNVLIEKKAPLKQSFLYLCSKAHYRVLPDKDLINKSLEAQFKALFTEHSICYGYSNIPDIQSEDLQPYEEKMISQTASMEDKAIINKYYYKKQFSNWDEDCLAFGWDNRYNTFFEKLAKIKGDENHLYNQIQQVNGWSSCFPEDELLNKAKLNEELIEEIFNGKTYKYYFKDLTRKSGHKLIIKHIYNVYFGKSVIGSKTKDKKNYSLTITENTRKMYEYGMANLKIYERMETPEEMDFIDIFNDE